MNMKYLSGLEMVLLRSGLDQYVLALCKEQKCAIFLCWGAYLEKYTNLMQSVMYLLLKVSIV